MTFLTGLLNRSKLKREHGVIQLYENKLITTVKQGKRIANDFRKTIGVKRLRYRFRVVDLPETMEEVTSGCRDLDSRVAQKLADFKLAEVRFFEADKAYYDLITLSEGNSSKTVNSNSKNIKDE